MPEIPVAAEVGRTTGSRAAGRLRRAGKVPGVIYGHGVDPISVAIDARALRNALTTESGMNALLDLKLDGTSHLTLAREVQRDPIRHTLLHVDFVIVRRDEIVTAEVPINLVGEAETLHREEGVVAQELFALTVHATPLNIPNSIEVDISALEIGVTIRVADLDLPSGVSTDVDPDAAVVTGQPPQVVVEEVPEVEEGEEAAEGEEGAEAPAAEGEAPAAAEGGEAPAGEGEPGE